MPLTTYTDGCPTQTCRLATHHTVVAPYAVLHSPETDTLTALYVCRVCGVGWVHGFVAGRDSDGVFPKGGGAHAAATGAGRHV